MRYIELTAAVPATRAEFTADLLRAATGADASIDVPFTQPDLESDAVPRPGGRALVRVYLRVAGDADAARAALLDADVGADVSVRDVAEEDWAEAWKEHFHIERFGERIVIVPSWRAYEPAPGDVVVGLDPGMAFGTGQHETTRMCIEALERAVQPGMRVLDVGSGSGILSLVAAKLGARVTALDTDPDCVRITTDNARRNGVGRAVDAREGSAGAAWPFGEPPLGTFDVIVANIVARVIAGLAPSLVEALAPGGRLIVSGVIGEREREVRDALTGADARIDAVRRMGEWRCIEAVRS